MFCYVQVSLQEEHMTYRRQSKSINDYGSDGGKITSSKLIGQK